MDPVGGSMTFDELHFEFMCLIIVSCTLSNEINVARLKILIPESVITKKSKETGEYEPISKYNQIRW